VFSGSEPKSQFKKFSVGYTQVLYSIFVGLEKLVTVLLEGEDVDVVDVDVDMWGYGCGCR